MASDRALTAIIAYYQERVFQLNNHIHTLQRKISLFSWLRLGAFLLFLGALSIYAWQAYALWLVISILSFITLVVLIVRHQTVYAKKDRVATLLQLHQNELDILNERPNFYDDGKTFASLLPFADDLDLFGAHSLFHHLNRCSTSHGKALLAEALTHGATEGERIKLIQQAVVELSKDAQFNNELQAILVQAYAQRDHREPHFSSDFTKLFDLKKYRIAAFVLPIATFIGLGIWVFLGIESFFVLSASGSLLIAFAQNRKMSLLSEETSGIGHSIKAYSKALAMLNRRNNEAKVLQEMHAQATEAGDALRQLGVIAEWFDRRSNVLLYAAGNALFAFDLHLALRYENWKTKFYGQMDEWLTTTGRLEMLVSLAVFKFNNPDYCFPALSEKTELQADQLCHPLISRAKRIANEVHLKIEPRVVLVTGSNMSGKSTWLRTLGVNVKLAQAGTVVCATHFTWHPMEVLSSLRQTDSLHENTSLFMHELLQLKYILEQTSLSKPSLVLLDEVLRGTNSDDKYSGSEALIRKLTAHNSLVVMATHDLKLSALEHETSGRVGNYCFESQIIDGQLLFDYKIRQGVAVNRNATWLMQEMGII